jgi:DNA invertase Pin-like site-specific DNA recombinase
MSHRSAHTSDRRSPCRNATRTIVASRYIPLRPSFHIHTPPFTEYRKGDLFSDVKSRKSHRKSHRSINDRLRSAVLSPLVGYMRVSKADGSQVLDLQKDALTAAGVPERNIYSDTASGKKDDRPGLDACLKAVRTGDTLVIWKLDRLGRNLRHLVNVVHDLNARGIGLRVLTGQGAAIDTTTAAGKLVFGIFAALAEFERELIRERTIAGLAAARARGRNGGRKPKMTPAKLRLAQAAMGKRGTVVADLCDELGVSSQTLYRHVSPTGQLRADGKKLISKTNP